MSATTHLLPLIYVAMLWFLSTALVVALDHRARGPLALYIMGLAAVAGAAVIALTAHRAEPFAAYAAFTAAFAIWGWHELAFLTGHITGPRQAPLPAGAQGWERFRLSAATVIHHEIALAATLALLIALSWSQPNWSGAAAFGLLFGLRLSTKLNIFMGVPNFTPDILPPQLAYLKSYFRVRPMGVAMLVSLAAIAVLTWWLAARALAADEAVGWSLLTGLAVLGLIEHLFLVLPLRDGALWRWAIPAHNRS
ncbi:MAG: putative photosynthetic complex assembly protein PuhE [Sphingomonadaceae bacterium]